MEIIYITGACSMGKTTYANKLGKSLDYRVIHDDNCLEFLFANLYMQDWCFGGITLQSLADKTWDETPEIVKWRGGYYKAMAYYIHKYQGGAKGLVIEGITIG